MFEYEDDAYSWGTEYVQIETLNSHSYTYFGGNLVEIEMNTYIENERSSDTEDENQSNEDNNDISRALHG